MKNLISLLILIPCVFIFPQESVWIETEGNCLIANITPEEAREKALNNARNEAIKQVVGVQVAEDITREVSETMVNDNSEIYDSFSKLSRSTSFGKIIKEDPLLEDKKVLNDDNFYHHVRLRSLVVKDEGKPDHGFEVNIDLQRDVFFDRGTSGSDEIRFKLKASKDCYIYLFNLMSNDSVQLLIPNPFIQDNSYIVENEEQQFEKDLANLSFSASVPPDKERVTEAFYVVALKEKIDFSPESGGSVNTGIIPTVGSAMTDIQNWLMKIPRDMRTETFKSFQIKKLK